MNKALLIRTDFSNEYIWNEILNEITTPSKDGYVSNVNPMSDTTNQSKSIEQIISNLPLEYNHTFFLVFDYTTVTHRENIILCVDLSEKSHSSFRVKPVDLWMVENNLSIANLDFEDFLSNLDSNNIFKGY